MQANETIAAASGLGILKDCLNCGYSLVGLPLEGRCPECGEAYDQKQWVIRGWGRGSKGSLMTAPLRVVVSWAFIALFPATNLLFPFYLSYTNVGFGSPIVYLLLAALVAAPPLLLIVQRMTHPESVGPSEVRLNECGCSQAMRKAIRSSSLDRLLIYFAGGSMSLKEHHNVSWTRIRRLRIWQGSNGRHRMLCDKGPWWNRTISINFEFVATGDEVAELERCIIRWRAAATGTEPNGRPGSELIR